MYRIPVLTDTERRRLRAARESKGLSRQALSERIHYSASAIEAVETGIKNPSLEFLRNLCRALELDIGELFD